jgi:hypothetical protein
LGVSVASIYQWEKQTKSNEMKAPPPEKQLRKFTSIIEDKFQKSNFSEVLMRIRSVSEVMDCGQFCKRFWVIRSGKPFVIVRDKRMQDATIRFLRDNEAFFVYRDPSDKDSEAGRRVSEAKASFDALLEILQNDPNWGEMEPKIHGIPIEDEIEAFRLGLTDPWASYAMAEYSEKGYAKFGKSVDVWMEFVFDVSKDPQFAVSRQPVWLELPLEEAEKWREQRRGFWEKAISTVSRRKSEHNKAADRSRKAH